LARPVPLHLAGPDGGSWAVGRGAAVTEVEVETVDYMRTLAGRNDSPDLKLIAGYETVLPAVAKARVLF
jgi:hypothetical protein